MRRSLVGLTRQAVQDAPPYDAAAHLDREQEQAMHEHYGRPGYWTVEGGDDVAEAPGPSRR